MTKSRITLHLFWWKTFQKDIHQKRKPFGFNSSFFPCLATVYFHLDCWWNKSNTSHNFCCVIKNENKKIPFQNSTLNFFQTFKKILSVDNLLSVAIGNKMSLQSLCCALEVSSFPITMNSRPQWASCSPSVDECVSPRVKYFHHFAGASAYWVIKLDKISAISCTFTKLYCSTVTSCLKLFPKFEGSCLMVTPPPVFFLFFFTY